MYVPSFKYVNILLYSVEFISHLFLMMQFHLSACVYKCPVIMSGHILDCVKSVQLRLNSMHAIILERGRGSGILFLTRCKMV
jgi:hypothetical protein